MDLLETLPRQRDQSGDNFGDETHYALAAPAAGGATTSHIASRTV